ncbi:unnamed protein product [Rotaria sp. Silwood2]|nr:unnamed protein product [Rotaria sp. Silwood2]CAF4603936.1 unnamed protein product [Rotaria sp. Silwood2]
MTKYLVFNSDDESETNDNNCSTLDDTCLKSDSDGSDDDSLEYHPSAVSDASSSSHLPPTTINTIGLDSNGIEKCQKVNAGNGIWRKSLMH